MTRGSWEPTSYDSAWKAMEEAGKDPHGEVAFLQRTIVRLGLPERPRILDAGCGTGRVAIELDRRGYSVEGTDLDASMLGHAAEKAPALRWTPGNLGSVAFDDPFDVVIMAGNVILFAEPHERADVVANVARLVRPGGVVIAGFQLARPDGRRVSLAEWDAWASAGGLTLVERFATWDDDSWVDGADYTVSVHRRASVR